MSETIENFTQFKLNPNLLTSLNELGYETPTPVQSASISILLDGHDLLAQAQTGTGKTAAFALPTLSNLDLNLKAPQILVIAPTRELAIQVAEAFQSYARHLKGFHVAPIYGGQEYNVQIKALKRGPHVVVGTPGRVMDHLRKGTLKLNSLKTIVLDEADEMLNMGFIDDVEWILEQIPAEHQTALFSATMPASIKKISNRYLKDAKLVQIKASKDTVSTIEQSCIMVYREHKLEALTRYLEVEDTQAVIIFSRTKTYSVELTEKLQARGYAAAALNGDLKQATRKQVLDKIKDGSLDIIVATDVAARGIDIDRISHVINFDIPYDNESYVHRIGRTGRAGRKGKALSIITPRERRLLNDIERSTGREIKQINPPSLKEMHLKRSDKLISDIMETVANGKDLAQYSPMAEKLINKVKCSPVNLVTALVCMLQQDNPMSSTEISQVKPFSSNKNSSRSRSGGKPDSNRRFNDKSGNRKRPNSDSKKSKFGGQQGDRAKFANRSRRGK